MVVGELQASIVQGFEGMNKASHHLLEMSVRVMIIML